MSGHGAGETIALAGPRRSPAVAGSFYPADPGPLRALVRRQLDEAERRFPAAGRSGIPAGLLVPHAGLQYSGVVAAAGWRQLRSPVASSASQSGDLTIVLLGTNHRAGWLDGIGAWDRGSWATPIGSLAVDEALAGDVVALGGPFAIDRASHEGEHSIEVQLPFVATVAPAARIVPLAVSTGTGREAIEAGEALGRLLAGRRADGAAILLAISTDMAHYPPHPDAIAVTERLIPAIVALDPVGLAEGEARLRREGGPALACGMCGIEPAVLGLAALRALGASGGSIAAAATSADAGEPHHRTVGYLAVAFD